MGKYKFHLNAITPDVETPVRLFAKFAAAFVENGATAGLICMIVSSPMMFDKAISPLWLSDSERERWGKFYLKLKTSYMQYCKAQFLVSTGKTQKRELFCFSWPEPVFTDSDQPNLAFRQERGKQYIALITTFPKDISYLSIWGYLFFLATRWHVDQGGLSLHSAAVARGNNGFLFLGRSKAGKSTVAELSAAIGLSALGDDLNFIISDTGNGYRLAAAPSPKVSQVGYSMQKPKLCGIFTLVQDKSDYLVPIMPIKLAPILFDSFIQQTPYVNRVADNLVGKAFQTVCDLARQIPGYELHFRKSPDFWKLIDEQFPG